MNEFFKWFQARLQAIQALAFLANNAAPEFQQILADARAAIAGMGQSTASNQALLADINVLIADLKAAIANNTITVPNVVGMTVTAANTAITGASLITGTQTSAVSTVPAGQIISQSPVAGNLVEAGSTVTFVVSSGPSS